MDSLLGRNQREKDAPASAASVIHDLPKRVMGAALMFVTVWYVSSWPVAAATTYVTFFVDNPMTLITKARTGFQNIAEHLRRRITESLDASERRRRQE